MTKEEQLRDAATRGDLATVQALLAAGADVSTGNYDGLTVLDVTAGECEAAIIEALREAGAI